MFIHTVVMAMAGIANFGSVSQPTGCMPIFCSAALNRPVAGLKKAEKMMDAADTE